GTVCLDLEGLERGRLPGRDVEAAGRGDVGDDVHAGTRWRLAGDPALAGGVDDGHPALRAADHEQAARPVHVEAACTLATVAPPAGHGPFPERDAEGPVVPGVGERPPVLRVDDQ